MLDHLNAPPGNGKSAFLMSFCFEPAFFKSADNLVVWSIPLTDFCLWYFARKYGAKYRDQIHRRITVLTFEEGLQWWRYRGTDSDGSRIVNIPEMETVQGDGRIVEKLTWPRLTADSPRVTYFLDEWADAYPINGDVLFTPEHKSALRQHRKMRMKVWCATPTFTELAKPYRDIGQIWWTVRNTAFETIGRGKASVTLPQTFQWSCYRRPPVSDRDRPFRTGSFTIQKNGIHKCYNTAGGAGINNAVADQDEPRGGVNKLWLIPIVVGALVIIVALLRYLPEFGTKLLMGIGSGRGPHVVPGRVEKHVPVVENPAGIAGPIPRSVARERWPAVSQPEAQTVTIRWVSRIGGDIRFGLSDGTELDNPRWSTWDGHELLLPGGRVLRYVKSEKK